MTEASMFLAKMYAVEVPHSMMASISGFFCKIFGFGTKKEGYRPMSLS